MHTQGMDMITIHRIRLIDVDGGRIGKTWQEWFYNNEREAQFEFLKVIQERNDSEQNRGRNYRYKPDEVDGINGYINWQYAKMYTIDSIEV